MITGTQVKTNMTKDKLMQLIKKYPINGAYIATICTNCGKLTTSPNYVKNIIIFKSCICLQTRTKMEHN